MDDEIQLISDGDGLAVIGDPTAVDRFLASEGLPSKELRLSRLGPVLSAGAAAANVGSAIAANSGRWVQLTKQSADLVHKYGLMQSKTPGVRTRCSRRARSASRLPGGSVTRPSTGPDR